MFWKWKPASFQIVAYVLRVIYRLTVILINDFSCEPDVVGAFLVRAKTNSFNDI